MTWKNYSPTPQCSNILPCAFWIVPPLLNLGILGTLPACKQAQPDHAKYTKLGFIFFSMLSDYWKESLPMLELWKLDAYQDQ